MSMPQFDRRESVELAWARGCANQEGWRWARGWSVSRRRNGPSTTPVGSSDTDPWRCEKEKEGQRRSHPTWQLRLVEAATPAPGDVRKDDEPRSSGAAGSSDSTPPNPDLSRGSFKDPGRRAAPRHPRAEMPGMVRFRRGLG